MKTLMRHNSIRIIFIACYIQFLLGQTNNWRNNLLPSTISGHIPGRPVGDRPLPTALSGPEDQGLLWSDPADAFHNPVAPTVQGPNHNHDHAGHGSSLLNPNSDMLLETSVSAIRDRHIPPTDVVFPSGQIASDSVGTGTDQSRRERRRQRRVQRRREQESARSNFLDTARGVLPSSLNPPTPTSEPIPGKGTNANNNNRRNKRLHSPNFPVPPDFVSLTIAEQILLLDRVEFLEEENARLENLLAKQKILLDERKRIVESTASATLSIEKEKKRLAAENEAARILAETERARIAAELAKHKQAAEKERKRLIAEAEAAKIRAKQEKARLEKEAKLAEAKRLAAIAEAKRLEELAKARATTRSTPRIITGTRRRRRRRLRRFFG